MRAIQISRYGPPDVLELANVADPEPAPGTVLVEVHAAAINPVDCKIRMGSQRAVIRPKLPATLGMDISGVVRAIGAGVRSFAVGDEVYASPNHRRMGGYAELALVDEPELAHKPKSVDHFAAASLPLAGLTAWDALVRVGKLGAGEHVLIQAGAGGVGSLAVQLAKHLGARVSATAGPKNVAFVRELGADRVIDYTVERYDEVARGCDFVVESLAGDDLWRAVTTVRRGGRVVALSTGLPDAAKRYGPWLGFALVVLRLALLVVRARISRNVRFAPIARRPSGEALARIAELVDTGALKPVVEAVLPLDQASEAHRRVESGHTRGKIVLDVRARPVKKDQC